MAEGVEFEIYRPKIFEINCQQPLGIPATFEEFPIRQKIPDSYSLPSIAQECLYPVNQHGINKA